MATGFLRERAGDRCLERDIAVATIRSLVQLTAIGYVITLIFDQNSLIFVFALIAAMVLFGAITARHRARHVPNAFWPLVVALALTGTTTLVLVVALGVFKANARYLVPVGGMVIGNAMTGAAVSLNRLGDEVPQGRAQIEATLTLGATASQAMRPILTRSLRSGMIPLIDSTKTTGLIFFPGTMVGMLLAGAAPVDARPPAAHPALRAAGQRRARRADGGATRLPQFLHGGPPAARAAERAGLSPSTRAAS